MLISGVDVLLQYQIPDIQLSLYHTLIVVLFQGFLIFLHIDECRVVFLLADQNLAPWLLPVVLKQSVPPLLTRDIFWVAISHLLHRQD
jgi:hypothetical protein